MKLNYWQYPHVMTQGQRSAGSLKAYRSHHITPYHPTPLHTTPHQ
eukprot:CAMPEP_0202904624 /NCGR_PEP_ID=MMETSP1392-20130828/30383_1 /ASSEMBLY_ACC=CAM_ASM_000868 /TAXON_ID=225041 /ORGANISM="Chlamydomonas chlamydogama, Strain SAG 11-48b" /LENGTH=44 /DNA_ID= /DNA_START= /DNA_END= /DNA_ORIENTATION=